jgi:hypothetical protein
MLASSSATWAVDFGRTAAGTGRETGEWTAVVNRPGAVPYARRARKARWYTALVLLFLLPLALIVPGAALIATELGVRSQLEPVAGWPQTTGRIVSFHTYQPYSANVPAYVPVIAFRAGGYLVTFSPPGLPDPPTVGAPAQVAYNPRDPADAHDLSIGSGRWAGPFYLGLGFVAFGVAFLAFFYWLVFVRPKSARRPGGAGPVPSDGRHVRSR